MPDPASPQQPSTTRVAVAFVGNEVLWAGSRAEEMASSLMSAPLSVAPSKAKLNESPSELCCRCAGVVPRRSPSSVLLREEGAAAFAEELG